jgi:hypothetical protein
MSESCAHLDSITEVTPSARGCEELVMIRRRLPVSGKCPITCALTRLQAGLRLWMES